MVPLSGSAPNSMRWCGGAIEDGTTTMCRASISVTLPYRVVRTGLVEAAVQLGIAPRDRVGDRGQVLQILGSSVLACDGVHTDAGRDAVQVDDRGARSEPSVLGVHLPAEAHVAGTAPQVGAVVQCVRGELRGPGAVRVVRHETVDVAHQPRGEPFRHSWNLWHSYPPDSSGPPYQRPTPHTGVRGVSSKGMRRPITSKHRARRSALPARSEEHTSERQSRANLVCRLRLEMMMH